MAKYRIEKDSFGEIKVNEKNLWGAQTQRSIMNFDIGEEKMPSDFIKAMLCVKIACARANFKLGKLSKEKAEAIENAAKDILFNEKLINTQFPLSIWQTGSGTQTNMNVNEVISNIAKTKYNINIHPNDDVNMSQSTNDVFPTAMHIATYIAVNVDLKETLIVLCDTLSLRERIFEGVIKVGRTHLQDAVPIKVSQEISGWRHSILANTQELDLALSMLAFLPIGGTAVGTGLNTPEGFDEFVVDEINEIMNTQFFRVAPNKFSQLQNKDALVFTHSAIKATAMNLMKIANDIRLLSSGPMCGIGEYIIPSNEPGSSIMPGKVNPTQCEQITMIATQILGNDTTISFAASQGNFELNVFMPVIIYNIFQSIRLLNDGVNSFIINCLNGLDINKNKIKENLNKSLMNVTALNPIIGYDKAAKVAKLALKENITLKQACVKLGYLTEKEFDKIIDFKKLV